MSLIYKEEVYSIVGACMEVHKELGNGFLEGIYQEALEVEFIKQKIPFEREKQLEVCYKGKILKKNYFADFVCNQNIIVEMKAVKSITEEHSAQIFNYLKATGLQLGVLVNFGEPSLNYKRIICTSGAYKFCKSN